MAIGGMKSEQLDKLPIGAQKILWKYAYPCGDALYNGDVDRYVALKTKEKDELVALGLWDEVVSVMTSDVHPPR